MTDAEVRRPVTAWVWGGGLLALSAALPALSGSFAGGFGPWPVLGWASRLAFAAAMVVFAFGIRRVGSVVARRPLGIVALLIVGVLLPLVEVISSMVFVWDPADRTGTPWWIGAAQAVNLGGLALWGAAALVASVQIVRARVVPDPWRWAPVWGLAVIAVVFAATQILMVGAGQPDFQTPAIILAMAWSAVMLLVPLALGVLAMMLGARGLALARTQIYPPPA